MSTLSIVERLAELGEVEFFACAGDPLAQRTFRVKVDKPAVHDIGWAVERLQGMQKVCRTDWSGTGAHLLLIPGSDMHHPTIKMRNAQGAFVAWTCGQIDLLARDWELA